MGEKNLEKIGNVILDYTYYSGQDFYSEGAAEDRLLEFVQNHDESEYDSYIQGTRSWSAMYHLSHIRQNVVSWLPIRENQTVLEVGSGCGAITGAFARIAREVTCVELSKKRSLINAYRNKEYDNITIMVGNFETIEPHIEEKYDYITLIGVLEYASSYISGDDPYNKFLDIIKKHLKPDGKIVIAIENRLGLKYFAGCKEDHLGQYFAGITGYTEKDGVKTFSKKSLKSLLEANGLDYRFYYPYPDYKLPHTIYSDDKLPSKGELNTNLRNFDADRIVLFDEEKAFDSFIEEGVFPMYSNSFVVMASPNPKWSEGLIMPIFAKYANDRLDKYRVNTMIAKTPEGTKLVFKKALSVKANDHIIKLCWNYDRLLDQYEGSGLKPVKTTYIKGVERGIPIVGVSSKARDLAFFDFAKGISMEDFLNDLESKGKYEQMEELILEYVRRLKAVKGIVPFERSTDFDEMFGKREFTKQYQATCPSNLDMIFSNLIFEEEEKEKGTWTVLDYEWVLDFAVPLQFIIYRSLFYYLRCREEMGFVSYLKDKNTDIYGLCGIDRNEEMLFEEMEHTYQLYIIGRAASLDVMRHLMPTTTMMVDQLVKSASYLRNLDTPKIYFSKGKNFSEDNQFIQIGKVANNEVNFKIDIEEYVANLRIDPTDYPCMIHINNVCYITSDGNRTGAGSVLVNGLSVSDRSYLFDTDDPQIIIEDLPDNVKAVEVSYAVSMPEKVFYDEIVVQADERKRKQEQEKRALAYRLKRKLGIIKEENLPAGYTRVIL